MSEWVIVVALSLTIPVWHWMRIQMGKGIDRQNARKP